MVAEEMKHNKKKLELLDNLYEECHENKDLKPATIVYKKNKRRWWQFYRRKTYTQRQGQQEARCAENPIPSSLVLYTIVV